MAARFLLGPGTKAGVRGKGRTFTPCKEMAAIEL